MEQASGQLVVDRQTVWHDERDRQYDGGSAMGGISRRRFLESTIVGSVPAVFAGIGGVPMTRPGVSLGELGSQKQLSHAIVDHVGSELARVYHAIRTRGSVRADDVRAIAANMRLLCAHLEEVGLNAAIEQYARESAQEALSFVPQEEHLREIHARLTALGIPVSRQWLQRRLALSQERKAHLLSQIERFGIRGVIKGGIGILNRFAARLEQQSGGRIKVAYVFASQDCPAEPGGTCICVCDVDCPPDYCANPEQEAAEFLCDALVFIASLWAIGCAIPGMAPIFCVAAALLFAFEALLDWIGFC